MGVAGAGIFSLGLASLGYPNLIPRFGSTNSTSAASSSSTVSGVTSASTTTTETILDQYSTLPDYQGFLEWLQSVSGPYRNKSLDISLEAEFGPRALQVIDTDFFNATGIHDNYNIQTYPIQLQDISLMSS